jgi:hypothetical protein
VVGGAQRSRARHVLGNDVGVAGDQPAVVPRQHAAIGVVAAARPVADLDGDRLALEISRLGRRRRGERGKDDCDNCDKTESGAFDTGHGIMLAAGKTDSMLSVFSGRW